MSTFLSHLTARALGTGASGAARAALPARFAGPALGAASRGDISGESEVGGGEVGGGEVGGSEVGGRDAIASHPAALREAPSAASRETVDPVRPSRGARAAATGFDANPSGHATAPPHAQHAGPAGDAGRAAGQVLSASPRGAARPAVQSPGDLPDGTDAYTPPPPFHAAREADPRDRPSTRRRADRGVDPVAGSFVAPLTEATLAARSASGPSPAAAPVIQVTIDRIDVRAPAASGAAPPPPRRPRPSTTVSLAEYLAAGQGERRR